MSVLWFLIVILWGFKMVFGFLLFLFRSFWICFKDMLVCMIFIFVYVSWVMILCYGDEGYWWKLILVVGNNFVFFIGKDVVWVVYVVFDFVCFWCFRNLWILLSSWFVICCCGWLGEVVIFWVGEFVEDLDIFLFDKILLVLVGLCVVLKC